MSVDVSGYEPISFWTPVQHYPLPCITGGHDFNRGCEDFIENYFSFGSQVVVPIQMENYAVLANREIHLFREIVKYASYLTVIIPIIMLVVKSILRSISHYGELLIRPHDSFFLQTYQEDDWLEEESPTLEIPRHFDCYFGNPTEDINSINELINDNRENLYSEIEGFTSIRFWNALVYCGNLLFSNPQPDRSFMRFNRLMEFHLSIIYGPSLRGYNSRNQLILLLLSKFPFLREKSMLPDMVDYFFHSYSVDRRWRILPNNRESDKGRFFRYYDLGDEGTRSVFSAPSLPYRWDNINGDEEYEGSVASMMDRIDYWLLEETESPHDLEIHQLTEKEFCNAFNYCDRLLASDPERYKNDEIFSQLFHSLCTECLERKNRKIGNYSLYAKRLSKIREVFYSEDEIPSYFTYNYQYKYLPLFPNIQNLIKFLKSDSSLTSSFVDELFNDSKFFEIIYWEAFVFCNNIYYSSPENYEDHQVFKAIYEKITQKILSYGKAYYISMGSEEIRMLQYAYTEELVSYDFLEGVVPRTLLIEVWGIRKSVSPFVEPKVNFSTKYIQKINIESDVNYNRDRTQKAFHEACEVFGIHESWREEIDFERIKTQYRKLVRRFHPDQRPDFDSERARTEFSNFNNAYHVLTLFTQ